MPTGMTRERFRELSRPHFCPCPDPDHADRLEVTAVMRQAIVDATQDFALKSARWTPGEPTPVYASEREIEDAAFIMYSARYWFKMADRAEFADFLGRLLVR